MKNNHHLPFPGMISAIDDFRENSTRSSSSDDGNNRLFTRRQKKQSSRGLGGGGGVERRCRRAHNRKPCYILSALSFASQMGISSSSSSLRPATSSSGVILSDYSEARMVATRSDITIPKKPIHDVIRSPTRRVLEATATIPNSSGSEVGQGVGEKNDDGLQQQQKRNPILGGSYKDNNNGRIIHEVQQDILIPSLRDRSATTNGNDGGGGELEEGHIHSLMGSSYWSDLFTPNEDVQEEDEQQREWSTFHLSSTGQRRQQSSSSSLLNGDPYGSMLSDISLVTEKYQMHPMGRNRNGIGSTTTTTTTTDDVEYGWTPETYPSPVIDPVGCQISSLLGDDNINNGGADPLLVCDPDSNLQGDYLQRIASAIEDFSFPLASPHFLPCFRESLIRSDAAGETFVEDASSDDEEEGVSGEMEEIDASSDAGGSDGSRANSMGVPAERQVTEGEGEEGDEIPTIPIEPTRIHVAVAVVSKIDLKAILRANSFYAYEDENDMINDAAQYFARYLHEKWRVGGETCGQTGVLIFLSIRDRVCYISTGSVVEAIVPWWRLEFIVTDMKSDLRRRRYGDAILRAIDDMRMFLEEGPPSFQDRAKDFVKRFGVVIAFAFSTFAFALWGEYRDRFRRWQYTERRSKLSPAEMVQAKKRQGSFRCQSCPICLEPFLDTSEGSSADSSSKRGNNEEDFLHHSTTEKVATTGSDGLPLKLLRCGHVFDQTCWRYWVNKGQGNPLKCPVCRQDIGTKTPSSGSTNNHRRSFSTFGGATTGSSTSPSTAATALNRANSHPNYESVNQARFAEQRRHRNRRDRALRLFRMNYGMLAAQHVIIPRTADDEHQHHGLLSDLDIPFGEEIDFHTPETNYAAASAARRLDSGSPTDEGGSSSVASS